MFKVDNDNTIIYLTRGDSAVFSVDIFDSNGDPYEMRVGDVLKLTVATAPNSDIEPLLVVNSNTTKIELKPEDTKEISVGQYSADIQLTTADGHVFTVYPNYEDKSKLKSESNWKNFWICPEVG